MKTWSHLIVANADKGTPNRDKPLCTDAAARAGGTVGICSMRILLIALFLGTMLLPGLYTTVFADDYEFEDGAIEETVEETVTVSSAVNPGTLLSVVAVIVVFVLYWLLVSKKRDVPSNVSSPSPRGISFSNSWNVARHSTMKITPWVIIGAVIPALAMLAWIYLVSSARITPSGMCATHDAVVVAMVSKLCRIPFVMPIVLTTTIMFSLWALRAACTRKVTDTVPDLFFYPIIAGLFAVLLGPLLSICWAVQAILKSIECTEELTASSFSQGIVILLTPLAIGLLTCCIGLVATFAAQVMWSRRGGPANKTFVT